MSHPFLDRLRSEEEERKRKLNQLQDNNPFLQRLRAESAAQQQPVERADREGVLGTAQDLGRGILTGLATGPAMVADLALAGPDLAMRGVDKLRGSEEENPFLKLRRQLGKGSQAWREAMDPRGAAGTVGEFVGGIPGGSLGFGPVAEGTGMLLEKAGIPLISKTIAKAAAKDAPLAAKVATNVVTGLPINALQAGSMPDASREEQLKNLAFGVGFDAAFPVLGRVAGAAWRSTFGSEGAKADLSKKLESTDAPKPVEVPVVAPGDAQTPERQAKNAEIIAQSNAKAEAIKNKRIERQRAETAVAAGFEAENPDKSWKQITKQERSKIVVEFMNQHKEMFPLHFPKTAEKVLAATEPKPAEVKATIDAAKSVEPVTLGLNEAGNTVKVDASGNKLVVDNESGLSAPATGSDAVVVEPETSRPAAVSKPIRHGTGIEQAIGIIKNGLNKGSSIDVGSGLSAGEPVVFEFGSKPGSQPYYRMDGSDPGSHTTTEVTKDIKAVYYDANIYSDKETAVEGYNALRQALDEAGLKDMPIQGVKLDYNDNPIYGGEVDYPVYTFAENVKRYTDKSLYKKYQNLMDAAFDLADEGKDQGHPEYDKAYKKFELVADELIARGVLDEDGNLLREPSNKRTKTTVAPKPVAPDVQTTKPAEPSSYQNSDKGDTVAEAQDAATNPNAIKGEAIQHTGANGQTARLGVNADGRWTVEIDRPKGLPVVRQVFPYEMAARAYLDQNGFISKEQPKLLSTLSTLSAAKTTDARRTGLASLWQRFTDGHTTPVPKGKRPDAVLEVAQLAQKYGREVTQDEFARIAEQVVQVHKQLTRQEITPIQYEMQLGKIAEGTYSSATPATPGPTPATTGPRSLPASATTATAAAAEAPTPATSGEFWTMPLSRPVAELLRLPGEEVKAEFKKAGIKYNPEESVLDNLKEHVLNLLDANEKNSDALLDMQTLVKLSKDQGVVAPLVTPAGAREWTSLPIEKTPDTPLDVAKAAVARKDLETYSTPEPKKEPFTVAQFQKLFGKAEAKLTNDELIALYNKMDDVITTSDVMTAAPYKAKQDRLLEEMARRNLNLPAEEVFAGGGVGGGVDKSIREKLGAATYNKELIVTAAKEAIQNALDSMANANPPLATNEHSLKVDFNEPHKTLTISDTGEGMLPDVVKNQFVDVGGSTKTGATNAGSFGVAKVGLFAHSKMIDLETIATDKDGNKIYSHLRGSNKDWLDGTMQFESYRVDNRSQTGSTLRLEYYPESQIKRYDLSSWLGQWSKFSDVPVKAEFNELVPDSYETLRTKREVFKSLPLTTQTKAPRVPIATIDLPHAQVNIYKSTELRNSEFGGTNVAVLNRGNYQLMTTAPHPKGKVPSFFVADIISKVDVNHEDYPFTIDRDQVRTKTKDAIDEYFRILAGGENRRRVEQLRDVLQRGFNKVIPGYSNNMGVFNDSDIPELEPLAQEISNSPWAIGWANTLQTIYDAVAKRYASNVPQKAFTPEGVGMFGGISLSQRSLGVNMPKSVVLDAAAKAGVQIPLADNLVLSNPFTLYGIFSQAGFEDVVDQTWANIVHEFSHQIDRNHGETYAGALTRVAGKSARQYAQFARDLELAWQKAINDPVFRDQYKRFQEIYANNPDNPSILAKYTHQSIAPVDSPAGSSYAGGQGLDDVVSDSPSMSSITGGRDGSVPPSNTQGTVTGPRGPEPERTRVTGGSVSPYIKGGLVGGVTGMVSGVLATDEADPDRWSKIAMWTAAGVGAGALGANLWTRKTGNPESYQLTIPNLEGTPKVVYSADELPGRKRPTSEWLRLFYQGVVRSSFGLERTLAATSTKDVNLANLPTEKNPGKLASMFGRYISMTESWLTHKPVFVDHDGKAIEMRDDAGNPIKPLQRILFESARGEKRNLDELLVARTTMELQGRHKTPMTIEHAARVIQNAPEYLHAAADEFRQYHLALLKVLKATGRISNDAFNTMKGEAWYAPLERVLLGGEDVMLQKGRDDVAGAPKGIYGRKQGSTFAVMSPYEKSVQMTARILRSAEYAQVVSTAWAASRMLPEGLGDTWMKRGENRTNPKLDQMQARVHQLVKELKITPDDAAGLLSYMDDTITTIDVAQGGRYLVTGYEDGKLRTYHVDREVFDTFKSLHPYEVDGMLKWLSLPTRTASKGVVYNPFFIFSQFFVDTFHSTLTSANGFRPGVDSVRGWWNIMKGDKRVQDLYALGGPSTLQGLKYTSSSIKKSVEAVKTTRNTPLDTFIAQIKEHQFIEAYKTVMLPIAEAARVGEYLRALDHGASTLEGVYAAWNVMGNVKAQGSFATMRAFNLMAMFARPAISAIDQTIYASGLPHPRRGGEVDGKKALSFAMKGFAAITLPSMYLWWANKDDEQINDLRRTESGQRYWFFRAPDGSIGKVRKPQVIGQVFGTLTENILDKMYADNPQGTSNAFSGMMDDIAFNMLPQIGVMPMTLMTGKVAGLGSNLVPSKDEKLEPELWGQDKASIPGRLVADKLGEPTLKMVNTVFGKVPEPLERLLSPAAFDLTVRTLGGMWGEDALKAVTYSVQWSKDDMPPPRTEAPVIGRLFGDPQSTNIGPIRMFYDIADQVDRKAKTVAHFAESDPTKLPAYMADNMPYLMLADSYRKARSNIAKNWRAIADIRALPDDVVKPSQKRALEEIYIRSIAAEARVTNTVAKAMLSAK